MSNSKELHNARVQLAQYIDAIAMVSHQEVFAWLRDEGQHFRGDILPQGVRRGKPRMCFNNCFSLLFGLGDGYHYAEGWAVPTVALVPIHHAWITTPDGGVIDPTWTDPDRCAYYGVAFGPDVVSMMCAVEYPGVFDNPRLHRLPNWFKRVQAGAVKVKVKGVDSVSVTHATSVEKSSCNGSEPT